MSAAAMAQRAHVTSASDRVRTAESQNAASWYLWEATNISRCLVNPGCTKTNLLVEWLNVFDSGNSCGGLHESMCLQALSLQPEYLQMRPLARVSANSVTMPHCSEWFSVPAVVGGGRTTVLRFVLCPYRWWLQWWLNVVTVVYRDYYCYYAKS